MTNEEKRIKFEELAYDHLDSLYSTALRMTRNTQEAEDLVQDTFLRAYRFFDKFELGTNFRACIFRILTNTFINTYPKKVRTPQKVDYDKVSFGIQSDHKYQEPTEPHQDYDEDAYVELFDDQIKGALDKLSDEFRMVILLADVEGLSYKEIASIADIPIGTVMSRLFRGRKILQRSLGRYAKREGFVPEEA